MEAVVTLRTPTSDNTPYASNSSILSDLGDVRHVRQVRHVSRVVHVVGRRPEIPSPKPTRGAPSRGCSGFGTPSVTNIGTVARPVSGFRVWGRASTVPAPLVPRPMCCPRSELRSSRAGRRQAEGTIRIVGGAAGRCPLPASGPRDAICQGVRAESHGRRPPARRVASKAPGSSGQHPNHLRARARTENHDGSGRAVKELVKRPRSGEKRNGSPRGARGTGPGPRDEGGPDQGGRRWRPRDHAGGGPRAAEEGHGDRHGRRWRVCGPERAGDPDPDRRIGMGALRKLARVVPNATSEYEQIIATNAAATAWKAETDSRGASATPTLASVKPPSGGIAAVAPISNWLLNDSQYDLARYIAESIGMSIGVAEATAFVSGDGTASRRESLPTPWPLPPTQPARGASSRR